MYLYTPIGARIQVTFGASPVTITLDGGSNAALVQAVTQNARLSIDPTQPATASDGMQIKAGDAARLIPLGGGESFTVQQETATSAFYVQKVRVDWVNP